MKIFKSLIRRGLVGIVASSMLIAAPQAQGAVNNNKQLITQNDISYLGYYVLPDHLGGGDLVYGQGLALRYVNGELRLLTTTLLESGAPYRKKLIEFDLPANYGDSVNSTTNQWSNIFTGASVDFGDANGYFLSLWWDSANNRLWTTQGYDYPSDQQTTTKSIFTRTLNNDGTISNIRGPFGLSGIYQRFVYGGAQATPTWFQSQYGVGPYMVGWGGYASRVLSAGSASMGLAAYTLPDPTTLPDNSDVPVGQFKTLSSHPFTTHDWYASGAPTSFDRGIRNSNVDNAYDGGEWKSPAPDDQGRWVWGDSNYNTGMWIETANKVGFVTVPSLACGSAFYAGATLNSSSRCFEFQVFNPADLGAAAQGTKQPWQIQPTNRWVITPPGIGNFVPQGDITYGNVAAAAFDSTTNKIYLEGMGASNGTENRIYVYQVNDAVSGNPPPPLVGDLNNDHIVNSLDWSIMNSKWFTNDATADLNHDGLVNAIDFSLLNANWFKTN